MKIINIFHNLKKYWYFLWICMTLSKADMKCTVFKDNKTHSHLHAQYKKMNFKIILTLIQHTFKYGIHIDLIHIDLMSDTNTRLDERKWHNFLVNTRQKSWRLMHPQIKYPLHGLIKSVYFTGSNTPSWHLIFILCRHNHDYLLSLFPSCTHNLTTLPTITKLYQTIICIQFKRNF